MELDFKQIRQIEYDILLRVDEIFSRLDLQFFLDFGTLLGARRHSGFVPWDDDIDIAMAPKSIEIFVSEAPAQLPQNLVVAPHPVFPPAVKVADQRYFMLERSKMHSSGTHVTHPAIDIFPFGFYKNLAKFLPTKVIGRIAQKRPTARTRAQILFGEQPLNALAFSVIAAIPPSLLRAYEKWIHLDSGRNWEEKHPTALLGHGLAMGTGTRNLPFSTVFPLRTIEFEGRKFLAPNDTDAYLTSLYGDWRTPVQYPQHLLRGWTA